MRDVTLFIAMSLDGFIADDTGGVDWLTGQDPEGPEPNSYDAFITSVDTVLMGWNTYHQITTELSPDQWPYDGLESYVITHRDVPDRKNIHFTSEDPVRFVEMQKRGEGKGIWICGGAALAQQLMRVGSIDRFHISIIPTILGSGIPLFGTMERGSDLELIDARTCNGIVELIYERRSALGR